MARTTVTRRIRAPVERVFQTVADIKNFSKAVSHIVKFEMLAGHRPAVGTRFRETRVMKGRTTTTELEITEYAENNHVRIVAESHGTVWDTLFTVAPGDGHTELRLTMEARAYKLLPKLLNPLVMGMVARAIAKDMDAVQAYCEQ